MPKRAAETEDAGAKRTRKDPWEGLEYMSGFACEFASELLPGALPKAQNSPQIVSRGDSLALCPAVPRGSKELVAASQSVAGPVRLVRRAAVRDGLHGAAQEQSEEVSRSVVCPSPRLSPARGCRLTPRPRLTVGMLGLAAGCTAFAQACFTRP